MEPLALIVVVEDSFGGLHRWPSLSMEVAVGRADGANRWHWWQRWQSLSTMVVFDGDGDGIEPAAPIVDIDGGVGGLCQQRSSWTKAAVGWIWRWPCPCVDGTDPTFFGKPVFVSNGRPQWRRWGDGANGSDHRHWPRQWQSLLAAAAVNSSGSNGGLHQRWSSLMEVAVGWSHRYGADRCHWWQRQKCHHCHSHQLPLQTTMTTITALDEKQRPMDSGGRCRQLYRRIDGDCQRRR
jgi:hypothetical protein